MDNHSVSGYSRKGREDLHETADRWLRARRALPAADQPHAERLAEMIRAHATDRLVVIGDPLEAAMFSLLIEMVKEQTADNGTRSAGGVPAGGTVRICVD